MFFDRVRHECAALCLVITIVLCVDIRADKKVSLFRQLPPRVVSCVCLCNRQPAIIRRMELPENAVVVS